MTRDEHVNCVMDIFKKNKLYDSKSSKNKQRFMKYNLPFLCKVSSCPALIQKYWNQKILVMMFKL